MNMDGAIIKILTCKIFFLLGKFLPLSLVEDLMSTPIWDANSRGDLICCTARALYLHISLALASLLSEIGELHPTVLNPLTLPHPKAA